MVDIIVDDPIDDSFAEYMLNLRKSVFNYYVYGSSSDMDECDESIKNKLKVEITYE